MKTSRLISTEGQRFECSTHGQKFIVALEDGTDFSPIAKFDLHVFEDIRTSVLDDSAIAGKIVADELAAAKTNDLVIFVCPNLAAKELVLLALGQKHSNESTDVDLRP
ncbi:MULTISPECIES: hypothetical protein [unclassified Caballeronia]|uniref:hypothetical protein n=1 Tax=unclassified Caballeronia TaxID=2646786 RepID=UPI0020276EB2|nr:MULTISPECIES: hypothetical protein [unclassified Caballeronia]